MFNPQKTSTPIGENKFSFSSNDNIPSSSSNNVVRETESFHPGNNTEISNNGKFPLDEMGTNGVERRGGTRNGEKRRHVVSLYENLENLPGYGRSEEGETLEKMDSSTAETDLHENKERDSTIWYEYGCV